MTILYAIVVGFGSMSLLAFMQGLTAGMSFRKTAGPTSTYVLALVCFLLALLALLSALGLDRA